MSDSPTNPEATQPDGNSAAASVDSTDSSGFKKRILVLPIAACVILAMCVWKWSQPVTAGGSRRQSTMRQPAPRFELTDQATRLVKFERYLGRHRILLVFFDGEQAPDKDARLLQVRAGYAALQKNDVVVVAVSGGLPQVNRSGTPFPFPILTDLAQRDPSSQFRVHRMWGSFDNASKKPQFKTFLIDRMGSVAWGSDGPLPLDNPKTVINALINGQDPKL